MHFDQTDNDIPNAGTALRWLDRNATRLKYSSLTISEQDALDKCITVLWELFLNGRENP